MKRIIGEIIICEGCGETILADINQKYCICCIDDLQQITNSKQMIPIVKDYVTDNFQLFQKYLIKYPNEKGLFNLIKQATEFYLATRKL